MTVLRTCQNDSMGSSGVGNRSQVDYEQSDAVRQLMSTPLTVHFALSIWRVGLMNNTKLISEVCEEVKSIRDRTPIEIDGTYTLRQNHNHWADRHRKPCDG